ncbi:hypothetical protein [Maribacter dokdonensis]|uniref:hypothetical protein n=1 Tax=Maribacter dokdonensis TaxID=320912 RepID=UPI001C0931DD|nr:hypothetical protein [Maribacter dokdonensis]MBU2902985.1 hypothetical protein [Maribacter dokdonensis]
MKTTIKRLNISLIALFLCLFLGCTEDDSEDDLPNESVNNFTFLKDIREDFFENLDFNSGEIKANIPEFKENISSKYSEFKQNYENGLYASDSDLEYLRLSGMYYSFYLLALGGNYCDGTLTFQDIFGTKRDIGFFSGIKSSEIDFEQKELNAMMEEASNVSLFSAKVNGFNDKSYGFHLSVNQVKERIKNASFKNSATAQNKVVEYVSTRLVNFDKLPDWNVLMSMVTFTNYKDSLNTFKNPEMETILFHVNARLLPGSLPDLGGIYPEIMGPIFRFDLNLKKIDNLLDQEELGEKEIEEIEFFINILDNSSEFVETERSELLQSWDHYNTYELRKFKLDEIKEYMDKVKQGNTSGRPELSNFLDSKDFKKAYQCYSCHKTPEY